MTDNSIERIAEELAITLTRVAGTWNVEEINDASNEETADRVGIWILGGQYEARVLTADRRSRIILRCEGELQPKGNDLLLLRKIVSVFNYDLAVVGDAPESREIWLALSQTRFLRAAARLSNISTDHLVSRIRIFEAAARQTYEGAPFAGSVVMPHNLANFRDHAGERYRPFNKPMPFHQALLREKWLKPLLEGGDFALVTVSRRGIARGFTDASEAWPTSIDSAPIDGLEGLYGYLRPGTSVLSASSFGDIHFALPTGVTFVNSKGQWRYQNWEPLKTILARHCHEEAIASVLRLVRSANYSHQGSLFVIVGSSSDVLAAIPDHEDAGRVAATLRATAAGLKLAEPVASKFLNVASRIDGAVVLTGDGAVADVASMVSEPSLAALRAAGHERLQRFSGARSTAAWNASIHGLAIKVSDDGPIDVYERGHLVFHAE